MKIHAPKTKKFHLPVTVFRVAAGGQESILAAIGGEVEYALGR